MSLTDPYITPRKAVKKTMNIPALRIDEDHYNQILERAIKEDRSLSGMTRTLIKMGLAMHRLTVQENDSDFNEDDA